MTTPLGDTLTTTGAIATVISICFAVASLIISRRRKHHAIEHHVVESPTPAEPKEAGEIRSTSSPLFKRLGRVGVEQVVAEPAAADDRKMIWE